ncbi:MAG: TetR/AcrR family transcriptional regulator [Blastocatellia bacterium]|nr:TetR/AcrR family transcriptional regulator [Blastocatellia bacterium]
MVLAQVSKARSTRMSAEQRRQQIVNVSAALFSEKGFNGTTTREIADRAGVSEAIIFRHFPNKQALYSAIIDYKTRQSGKRIKEHLKDAARRKDDRAFFGALALDLMEMHMKDHTLMRLLMFSALEGHELSEMFFQSTVRDVRDYVRRYIKQRISDGAFREIDPVVCARGFVGMIFVHAQIRVLYKGTSCDDVKLSNRQIADRLVDLFLNGACKKGQST